MSGVAEAPLSASDEFAWTTPAVTTVQLVRYAGASDDYNRIHYDLPFAVESGLGGVIAHGMLTMGFMARALTDGIGPAGRVQKLSARFTAPVRPGDAVDLTCKVTARRKTSADQEIDCVLVATVKGKPVAEGKATASIRSGT